MELDSLLTDASPIPGESDAGSLFSGCDVINNSANIDSMTHPLGASSSSIGPQFDPRRTFETAWHAWR